MERIEGPMRPRTLGEVVRDRRGVALPLALVGLVAVSLLVTTALVTSSTELALSGAHQDGTRGLYEAEGALEEYVALRSTFAGAPHQRLLGAPDPVAFTTGAGRAFSIGVAEMHGVNFPTDASGDFRREETFSLVATPEDGRGRTVGALLTVERIMRAMSMNINSGATLGANTILTGSSFVSGKQDRALCAEGADSTAAVVHAAGTTVAYNEGGKTNVDAAVESSALDQAALADYVLNGLTIDEAAARAEHKFGAAYGTPAFNVDKRPNSTRWSADDPYNWGCPGTMDVVQHCHTSGGDTTDYVSVAMDANGGTVTLKGDHGQGMLFVVNGNVLIEGNFVFRGIIVVEGATDIKGSGSGGTKIQGAVVGLGGVTVSDPNNNFEGSAVIKYNACEIRKAQDAMNALAILQQPQQFTGTTHSWYEVVR